MAACRYSIWILPDNKTQQTLQRVMIEMSDRYGGPKFETHLTLLGNFLYEEAEVAAKTKQVAAQLKPFTVTLGGVEMSTTTFQCVFVRIKTTAPLFNAHLLARKELGAEDKIFMPHISLVYGDYNMKTREKMITQIKLPPMSFEANQLCLVPSIENIDKWQHLIEVPLGNN